MSRIIGSAWTLVMAIGMLGCNAGVSEQGAAKEGATPTPDKAEMDAGMESMQQHHEQSQAETPEAPNSK